MSLKTYNIDVPITPGVMPPVIHIGQYDSGRDYICHLKNDDGTDYTIPSNSTATFTGCNPRKEVFEIEATVGETTVTFQPSGEATSMFGKYGATINITAGGDKMSPIVILMDVQKAGATDEEIAGAANFPDAVTEAVNDFLEEALEEGDLGSLYVTKAAQIPATEGMTQPVGITPEGALVTASGGGGGGGGVSDPVRYNTTQDLTDTQKARARTNIGAGTYSKPSGGIPASDMAQAVQTALTAAGTAVQPSALSGYVPTAVFAAVTPSADLVEVKRDTSTGKLYVLVSGGGGGGSGDSSTVLITMTESGSTLTASKTSSEIYTLLSGGAVNLVLIDTAGRQGTLVKKPTSSGGGYTDAKFWAFDENTTGIIEYSINSSGVVSYATIPLSGFYTKPSGGIPASDLAGDIPASKLASAVQTSLGKADSAYQLPLTGMLETDLATESVVISPGQSAGQYVSSKTYQQIAQAASDGYAIKPEFWPDNNTTIRGAVLDIGSAASVFAFIDAEKIYVFTVNAQGASAQIVTPLNADLLTAKTAAMTQAVGYRSSDGTLWTVPGGGGGSGAELFEVTISVSGSVYSASETVADIMTAYQSGKLVKYYNEVGAEGLLFAAPTAFGITFVCFDDSDGGHPTMMTIYSIAADGTVTVSSEDILNGLIMPGSQTRTASQMASGLLTISNVVYTITGDATGFVLTNSTNPISKSGECVEIRLTVGSTAITTPTWPSWAKLMNGWDGNFSANTYYDIIIDDAGNVYAGTREVSA